MSWLLKSTQTVETSLWTYWIVILTILPSDSGTLVSTWDATFALIRKEDFGPIDNRAGAAWPEEWDIWSPCPGSGWVWLLFLLQLQPQSTTWKDFGMVFSWKSNPGYTHPYCFCTFFLLPYNFLCALIQHFGNIPLVLQWPFEAPPPWGGGQWFFSDQLSGLPHDWDSYRTRLWPFKAQEPFGGDLD